MPVKVCTALLCCLLFLGDGCQSKRGGEQKSTTANPTSATNSPSSINEAKPDSRANSEAAEKHGLEACRLIEKSEIESMQGAKVREIVPSGSSKGALTISRCHYTVFSSDGSKNLSVHLEVMRNDPTEPAQDPVKALWSERFQGAKDTKKSEAPKSIAGVGDGAYWVGNSKIGALYALQKDKLVRLSVGGPGDEEMKIRKAKALAEKVLKRLS